MKRNNLSRLFVAVGVVVGLATPAFAQLTQTYVSGAGKDTFPCTREKPCRTFAAALAAVAAEGEVIVLDSAGYGLVTIDKAVSIVAPPGVYAGVPQSGGATGVTVNAPAGAVVVLRGLTIKRAAEGFGGFGLRFNSGGQLHVENCVIEGPFADAVVAGATSARLFIRDTSIRGGIDEDALDIFNTETLLERVHVETTALKGMEVAFARVTIRDSSFARADIGVIVSDGGDVTIENSQFTGHGTALSASSGVFRVSSSVIANNGTGVGGSGQRISFGNNRMAGNGADGTFTSVIPLQ